MKKVFDRPLRFSLALVVGLGLSAMSFAYGQTEMERPRLMLSDAVRLALEVYPSVRAARAGEEAAFAAVGQATAARWPRLSTSANLTHFEEPMLVRPLHRLDISAVEFDETLIQGNVGLAWTLYDGGARGARIRGARAEAASTRAGRVATEMMLTAQVAQTYLEVLTAQGVLEAEDRRIEVLAAERRRVEQLLEQGRAARVELLRVDAALAQAEAERVAKAARLDLAERDLARRLGIATEGTRAALLVPVHLRERASLEERSLLFERAQRASPELEGTRHRLAAAEADRRLAVSGWIPRLDFNSAYLGYSSPGKDVTLEWQTGVSFSWPLFTAGARSSTVRTATAGTELARQELRLAELMLEAALDRALSDARQTQALVDAIARAVLHQSEVARIELLSLEAGAGTQTDYLRAEAELLRIRSALIEAQHAEVAASIELARVVGILAPDWLNSNLENTR